VTEPTISFKGPSCERCGAPLPRGTEGATCAGCRASGESAAAAADVERAAGASAAPAPGPEGEGPPSPPPAEVHDADHGHGGLRGHPLPPDEEPRWIDHPGNVRKLIRIFWVACALLLAVDLLDLVGVLYHKHPHYAVERAPGFYGIYGFVSCVALVLLARLLRRLVMRGEDYYG